MCETCNSMVLGVPGAKKKSFKEDNRVTQRRTIGKGVFPDLATTVVRRGDFMIQQRGRIRVSNVLGAAYVHTGGVLLVLIPPSITCT